MAGRRTFDVIVCGSLHLDIVVNAPNLPRLDETVTGSHWGKVCGGKGGNQAVMSARLGAKTAMIGAVGDDDFGGQLLSNLQAATVDCTAVARDPTAGSGMSVAVMTASGDYGAVIVSGSNLNLVPADSVRKFHALGGASVLVLQNEIPEAVNLSVANAARASGARVVLNAAPARTMGADFLDAVDVLVVNIVEAEMMSGLSVTDAASAMLALPALGSAQRDVVVTLGGKGLVFQAKGGKPAILAPHSIKVVSTHGAGDCFIGAVAKILADGGTLADACTFANLAAARFVSLPLDERSKIAGHLEKSHASAH